MKKIITLLMSVTLIFSLSACGEPSGQRQDTISTLETVSELQERQPTPTDLDFSLERYNLIRRAYWVNGQREKAAAVVCQVEKPLGYIILFTESGSVVGRFVVDGKVSSLNSYLTPDSEEYSSSYSRWMAPMERTMLGYSSLLRMVNTSNGRAPTFILTFPLKWTIRS